MKVYLAGPEVFLPNAREVLDRKIALTRAAGFEPLVPGDLEIPPAPTRRQFGENIYRVNEHLMMSADAIIANLTLLRGLHADAGTIFELGFMCGCGRPAFAYSNVTRSHHERLHEYYGGQVALAPDGKMRGPDGMLVENFDMNENLILDGGIAASGGAWTTRDVPDSRRYTDTAAFEAVLTIAAQRLLARQLDNLQDAVRASLAWGEIVRDTERPYLTWHPGDLVPRVAFHMAEVAIPCLKR